MSIGRFEIEQSESGYLLIDNTNNKCLEFDTKKEANNYRSFLLVYIKKHGKVDLDSAPINLNEKP